MLHLVHRALARIFVATPAQKSCAVSKPAACKMIIGDFYDNFWRDWLPFAVRSVLQRLGPPGRCGETGWFSQSLNFSVNARRSDALKPEINPT